MQDRSQSPGASGRRPPLEPRAVGEAALLSAARRGDVAGVLRASLNGVNVATATDSSGRSALHLAALNGGAGVLETLKQLMGRGHAAFNASDGHGNAPLHFAARALPYDSRDAVAALLDAGACPDVRDAQGRTAVEIAREKGNTFAAALLTTREQRAGG